jgi:hypothetical protein
MNLDVEPTWCLLITCPGLPLLVCAILYDDQEVFRWREAIASRTLRFKDSLLLAVQVSTPIVPTTGRRHYARFRVS